VEPFLSVLWMVSLQKENFYESEMFVSYYAVISKQNYKEWLKDYVDLVDLYHKDAEEQEKNRQKEHPLPPVDLHKPQGGNHLGLPRVQRNGKGSEPAAHGLLRRVRRLVSHFLCGF